MARGLFSGLVWGAISAFLIVVVASLYAPLPGPSTGQVDLVAGTEFGRPAGDRRVDPLPVEPPSTVGASAPVILPPVDPDAKPEADASVAPVPTALSPADVPGASVAVDPDATDVTTPKPQTIVLPSAAAPLPQPRDIPDALRAVTAAPRLPDRPVLDETLGDMAPLVPSAGRDAPVAPTPEPLPDLAMAAPSSTPPGAAAFSPDPTPMPPAPAAQVSTRLPTIGSETPAALTDTQQRPLGALARNAQPFRNLLAQPLFSVVLRVDDARDLSAKLADLPLPIAVILSPASADLAPVYAAAGIEVLLRDDALSAAPSEAALRSRLTDLSVAMPEALAVYLPVGAPTLKDRAALDALFQALSETGHGAVALPQGLDMFAQRASLADVPAAAMFRRLDANDEDAPLIRRYLDRAAFEAAQTGAVIMLGQARDETLVALRDWSASRRAKGVALAPVSAILLGVQAGG